MAGLVLLTAGFCLGRCTAPKAEEPLTTGSKGRPGWLPSDKKGADKAKDSVKYVANPAVDGQDGTNGKEDGGKSNGQKSETNQQSDKQGR